MSEDFFQKIYLSLYCKVCVWEEVGDRTKTAIYWPPLLWPSALCPFSFTWCPTGGPGAHSADFLYCILSPTGLVPNFIGGPKGPFSQVWLSLPHLVSNSSDLQLTDFLSSLIYMIVQSSTQSLEWHVWSSSSRNNCHAVQRSLSSGASVYECIMGFYLVPFHQPNPPTRFLSITGYWDVSLPSGASLWNGMFGWVEGQNTTSSHYLIQYLVFDLVFNIVCEWKDYPGQTL